MRRRGWRGDDDDVDVDVVVTMCSTATHLPLSIGPRALRFIGKRG